MFYSNYNGREDFPCKKRTAPKSEYDATDKTPLSEDENAEDD